MRLFYFLARNVSYTFAIALYVIIIEWLVAVFGAFLGSSFQVVSIDKINPIIFMWLAIAVGITTFIFFIHSGMLTGIGIPAFFTSHRRINKSFKANLNLSDADLKRVYRYFSNLPMQVTMITSLYIFLTCIVFGGFIYYEYSFSGGITLEEINVVYKAIVISIIIIMILCWVSSYLFTEAITNNERVSVYNHLLRNGIRVYPRVLIGIKAKLVFFIILMVIVLITFAAFMERSRLHDEYNIEIIVAYLAVAIVAGFTLMQVNTNSIVRILSDMSRVTREIATGGKATFRVLSLEKEFASIEYDLMEMAMEIEEHRKNLEENVNERTLELQDALTDLKQRDDQMQKQLDMASVIQRSILPGKIDDWNELKFSTRYIALDKIGGDFYDVFQLKDDKLGVMIADVSGHGISAALVTTMAKMSFGNEGSKYDSPKKIFQEVNQNILDHVKTQDYMSCFMVAIDDEYNVVYSNASHQKAIHFKKDSGKIELLDTNGLFIGAMEEARDSYEEKSTKLNYGDRLILYSDGIPETSNVSKKEYSIKKLQNIIQKNSKLSLDEFSTTIIEDVQRFRGDAEQNDDVSLLVVELVRDEAVDIVRKSKKLIEAHKNSESIKLLENGMKKYPQNQKILYNLAKSYFRINDFNKSVQNAEKYIEKDKRNKFSYYICGASYYQMKDYQYALQNFEAALKLDPNFVNVLFASGMVYKKMGNFEQALKAFNKVMSIDSTNKMAMFEIKLLREEEQQEAVPGV